MSEGETRHRRKILLFLAACGVLGYGLGIALTLWELPVMSGVLGVFWALPFAILLALVWSGFRVRPLDWGLNVSLLILGGVCLFVALWAPQSRFLPNPYIDTCFAPGFHRESFDQIHPGMTTEEVEKIAGAPFVRRKPPTWGYILPGDLDLVWTYSTDNCSPTWDYAWQSYQVGFRNGTVVTVSKAWRHD